jgi:hypothetical protein
LFLLCAAASSQTVIPGLIPGIHVLVFVDGRAKPDRDE